MENIDYCEAMKSKSFLYERIFKDAERDTHGVVHKCPLLPGLVKLTNLTDDTSRHHLIPNGDYFLNLKLYNNDDVDMFALSLNYSLKSRSGITM